MYIHLTIRHNSFYDMVIQYKRTTSPQNLQLDINWKLFHTAFWHPKFLYLHSISAKGQLSRIWAKSYNKKMKKI